MNCKQGDLAIVIRSNRGTEGRIVRCVRFIPRARDLHTGRVVTNAWAVELPDGRTCARDGKPIGYPDAWLRPIRDPGDDTVDEVIQRLGKPQAKDNPTPVSACAR